MKFESFFTASQSFTKGSLNLLASRPGMGRTTLALVMGLDSNLSVLYVSLNDSQEQLFKRIEKLSFNIDKNSIEIVSTHFDDVDQLIDFLIKKIKEIDYDYIVIDDFQNMYWKAPRLFTPKAEQYSPLLIRLKQLALAMDKPILITGIGTRKFDQIHFTQFFRLIRFQKHVDKIIIPYRWEYYGNENLDKLKQGEMILQVIGQSRKDPTYFSLRFDDNMAEVIECKQLTFDS